MPEPWFWAAVIVTLIASYLNLLVRSQRQPRGRAWLRWCLYVLRHPLQALRDFGWGVVYMATLLLLFLSPILVFSLLLLTDHSTSMLVPGCFWPFVILPVVAVVLLVGELRTTWSARAEQRAPGGSAAEPDR